MPWLSNPEQPETAPSVELYSVLIGNLPSKPVEVVGAHREGFGSDKEKDEICNIINSIPTTEWQLAVTSAMFDRAIPGEEHYTSSVAAVSIMPDSKCLAKSWRKWYTSIGAQRRLKYVRGLLEERGYEDSEGLKEMGNKYLTDPFEAIEWHGKGMTAMYSRELAQSSAMCCPLGCSEEKIKNWSTAELIDLESELLEIVLMASHSLRKTQNTTIAKQNHLTPQNQRTPSKTEAKTRNKRNRKMSDELNLAAVFDRKDNDLELTSYGQFGHGHGHHHSVIPSSTQLKGKENAHHGRSHTMINLGSTIKPTPFKKGARDSTTLGSSVHLPSTDTKLKPRVLNLDLAPSSSYSLPNSPSDDWRHPHLSPFHHNPRPSKIFMDEMKHFDENLVLDIGASPSSVNVDEKNPSIEVRESGAIKAHDNVIYHPGATHEIRIDLPPMGGSPRER